MARSSRFVCQQCGYAQIGWAGKCPGCDAWGSLVETVEEGRSKGHKGGVKPKPMVSLAKVASEKVSRIKTGIGEFDRVLGGGLVAGQVVLLAGEPGIGKSTLLLQIAHSLGNCVYVTGEESVAQVKVRAQRLTVGKNVSMLEETDVDVVLGSLKPHMANEKVAAVLVDSIQTMHTSDLVGIPGSVGQVKETTFRLIKFAKSTNIPLIIVGHVTKEGVVAGPATLAHMVDTICWFEGDKNLTLRILRANKNRFGSVDEIGIFQMKDNGLAGTSDAESLFLGSGTNSDIPGSVISCVMEGTRPILVEIQALVVPTSLAIPRRVVQGLDSKRVELMVAVLTRHCGLHLSTRDVFVNVVGGIRVNDPGVDLAVAFAIASSYKNKPVKRNIIIVGEVGLLGEIRESTFEKKRLERANRQGLKTSIASKSFKVVAKALSTISVYSSKTP